MHESERHRVILSAVEDRAVVTVVDLGNLTGASEATIRRDVSTLHMQKKVRRVRGGVESVNPPQFVGLAGRTFDVNETFRIKRSKPSRVRLPSFAQMVSRSSSMAGPQLFKWCIRWRTDAARCSPIPFPSPSTC